MPSLVFRRESLARNLEISRKCPHSRTVLVDCYLESHKKMRLLPLIIALPCILAETQEASEYSSSCSDDGKLVIRIPYSNEKISDLLNFNAGTCSGFGESSENHLYHFDGDTNHVVLSVDIEACGLSQILTDQPQLTRTTGSYFMATANVSIGAVLDGHEVSFYNEVVGAECGYQKEYTIEFDYRRKGQIGV